MIKNLFVKLLILGLLVPSFSLSTVNCFASEEENKVVETGEIVRVEVDENAYVEVDKVYADKIISITSVESDLAVTRDSSGANPIARYQKTVVVENSDTYFAPSIQYKEYNYGAWFSGTLYFVSAEYRGGKYYATYTGTIRRFSLNG